MAYATLGQLDKRLTEIDDILLGADIGELHLDPAERSKLEAEGEAILQLLAKELAKRQNLTPEEIYETRRGVRELNHIAGIMKKHVELHPEPNPEQDKVIAEAWKGFENGTKTKEEAAEEIASVYRSVFLPRSGAHKRRVWTA